MLTLFFVDDLPRKVGSSYEFDSDDAQHAIRVLRMSAGEVFSKRTQRVAKRNFNAGAKWTILYNLSI